MNPPEKTVTPRPRGNRRAAGIAAHVLVVIFAITGVVVQLYVPRFVGPLRDLGEQPLPFYTEMVLQFQHGFLVAACMLPAAAVFFAWRYGFKAPLPKVTLAVLVLATILEMGTAFALIKPMHGVIEDAEKIKPVETPTANVSAGTTKNPK